MPTRSPFLRTASFAATIWATAATTLGGATPHSLGAQPAATPTVVPLWPAGAPGALGNAPEDRPSITPFLPDPARATGAAMLVYPGGGYTMLAFDKEGTDVAGWLNSLGVAAFVVRYRLGPRYHHPAMEQDALRAVRVVRSRAAEWHVDAHRIGVIGFSAGGHMAGTVTTRYRDPAAAAAGDATDRLDARPDLAVLIYPVVTMGDSAHAGSRTNLLGAHPDPALVRALSLETQVTRETPPTFLVAATDDDVVPVENSLLFYRALHAAAVPAELHVYEQGGHGFGLAPGNPVLSTWASLCAAWLGRHGFLARVASAAP
ncbi:MAG TPA: alpha/beta hydrolase [Gemmatirosa sp.]